MLRHAKISVVVPLILVLGMFSFVSCTQDEEKPEEAVAGDQVDSPGAPEDGLGGDLSANTIYFAFDDYTLSMDAQATLNRFADTLKSNQSAVVQIEGHCDERGSIEYNLALGEKRAQSVKNYLVQLGIEPARLTTISYGEEKPVAEGHDESAWSRNRRGEFVVSSR